jgi:hypothetical protein
MDPRAARLVAVVVVGLVVVIGGGGPVVVVVDRQSFFEILARGTIRIPGPSEPTPKLPMTVLPLLV